MKNVAGFVAAVAMTVLIVVNYMTDKVERHMYPDFNYVVLKEWKCEVNGGNTRYYREVVDTITGDTMTVSMDVVE